MKEIHRPKVSSHMSNCVPRRGWNSITTQPPQHMVAFVVGIGNYKVNKRFKNPVSDADAIQHLLEAQNVEVFNARDCNINEFREQFDIFLASLRPGDAAFLFFAGHGTEFRNSVRLMAISESAKPDLEKDALNLDVLIAK